MLLSEPIRIEAHVTRALNVVCWLRLFFFSFFFFFFAEIRSKSLKKKERRLAHQSIINVKLEDGELTDNLYVTHDRSAKCFIFLFSNLTLYSLCRLGEISGGGGGGGGPRVGHCLLFQFLNDFLENLSSRASHSSFIDSSKWNL